MQAILHDEGDFRIHRPGPVSFVTPDAANFVIGRSAGHVCGTVDEIDDREVLGERRGDPSLGRKEAETPRAQGEPRHQRDQRRPIVRANPPDEDLGAVPQGDRFAFEDVVRVCQVIAPVRDYGISWPVVCARSDGTHGKREAINAKCHVRWARGI